MSSHRAQTQRRDWRNWSWVAQASAVLLLADAALAAYLCL